MLTSRTLFTWKQKAELWERWKNGQSVLAISRGLERRNKTGVQRIAFSQTYLNSIALRLNQRPRKTLGFETPADRLRLVLH